MHNPMGETVLPYLNYLTDDKRVMRHLNEHIFGTRRSTLTPDE